MMMTFMGISRMAITAIMAIFQYWLLWDVYVIAINMVFMGVFLKCSKNADQQRKKVMAKINLSLK